MANFAALESITSLAPPPSEIGSGVRGHPPLRARATSPLSCALTAGAGPSKDQRRTSRFHRRTHGGANTEWGAAAAYRKMALPCASMCMCFDRDAQHPVLLSKQKAQRKKQQLASLGGDCLAKMWLITAALLDERSRGLAGEGKSLSLCAGRTRGRQHSLLNRRQKCQLALPSSSKPRAAFVFT